MPDDTTPINLHTLGMVAAAAEPAPAPAPGLDYAQLARELIRQGAVPTGVTVEAPRAGTRYAPSANLGRRVAVYLDGAAAPAVGWCTGELGGDHDGYLDVIVYPRGLGHAYARTVAPTEYVWLEGPR